MNITDKVETFNKQLLYINSDSIRGFVIERLVKTADYFFIVPASSTGKYHPNFTTVEHGLVLHTKFAVEIANELLKLEQYTQQFSETTRDCILAALILHDTCKSGITDEDYNYCKYTRHEHPELFQLKAEDTEETHILIKNLISKHMGEWNTNKRSITVLQKPETEEEKFVHMCDYLASRKVFDDIKI